jgi:hypothetical protein
MIFQAVRALHPNASFEVRNNVLVWKESSLEKPTEAEIQAKIAELQAAEPLRQLRRQRNRLLTETDWRMVADYPGTNQTEWQTYRQALRDITTQTPSLDSNGQLTGITWPIEPND